MRITREKLLEKYPSWNESRHDIVAVNYGDEPLIHYDQEEYERYQNYWSKDSIFANTMAANAYIYSKNGTYDIYNTLIGSVHISEDGRVLCGDVNVKYRGKTHNIILNMMYGFKNLDILRLGGKYVVGFSNADGQGSPSRNTEEMDSETINRILNDPLSDYGIGIQKFMEAARELYAEDTTNHIMEKRFGVRKDG